MAKIKNTNLSRVSFNCPNAIISKVKKYADSLGINVTSAYIVLLNQALEQKDMMYNMPNLFAMYDDMKKMTNNTKSIEFDETKK